MNELILLLNFKKYNLYIWSSFFFTFLLLFIQLIISIIIHINTKKDLKKLYKNDKNNKTEVK